MAEGLRIPETCYLKAESIMPRKVSKYFRNGKEIALYFQKLDYTENYPCLICLCYSSSPASHPCTASERLLIVVAASG